jgi:hypothetical protein
MILDAHQQSTLAEQWAQQAKTLSSPRHEPMSAPAKLMANLAGWDWTRPDDSQTAKKPCSPETLIERGFGDGGGRNNDALQALGERESGIGGLEEAVNAFRNALTEWTRERVPLESIPG